MAKNTQKGGSLLIVGDVAISLDIEDSDHVLFFCLGGALTDIQVFETTLLIHLAIFRMNKKNEDFLSARNTNIDKTLGQLARLFIDVVKDNEIGKFLLEVRDRRNFIVHEILRKYGWPIMSKKDYLKCYEEINEFRDFINQANMKLGEFLNSQHFSNAISIATNPKTGKPYTPGRDDLTDLFEE